jgi:hypothetical protein
VPVACGELALAWLYCWFGTLAVRCLTTCCGCHLRQAVTFLKRIKEVVEDPRRLLLSV